MAPADKRTGMKSSSSVALNLPAVSTPAPEGESTAPPMAPRATQPKVDTTGFTTPRDTETPRFRRSAGDAEQLTHTSVPAISMSPRADLAVEIPKADPPPKRHSAPPRLNLDVIHGRKSGGSTVAISSNRSSSSSAGSDDDHFYSGCQPSETAAVLKPNPNYVAEHREGAQLLTIQEDGNESVTSNMESCRSMSVASNRTVGEFWQDVPGVDLHFRSNAANVKLKPELRGLVGVWTDMLGSTYVVSAAEWNGSSLSVTTIRDGGASRYTNNLIRFKRHFGQPRITWGQGYELELTHSPNKIIWAPIYENYSQKPFYWLRRYQCDSCDPACMPCGKEHMRHPYHFGQVLANEYRNSGSWPMTRKEVKLLKRKASMASFDEDEDVMDWYEKKLSRNGSRLTNTDRRTLENHRVSVSSMMTGVPDGGGVFDATPRTEADNTPRTDAYVSPRKPTPRSMFGNLSSRGTPRKTGTPRAIASGNLSGRRRSNRMSMASAMTGLPMDEDVIYEHTPRTEFGGTPRCDGQMGDVCMTCGRPSVIEVSVPVVRPPSLTLVEHNYIGTPRTMGTPREQRRQSLNGDGKKRRQSKTSDENQPPKMTNAEAAKLREREQQISSR